MKRRDLSRDGAERRALKRQYEALFVQASALLHRFDPIGIGPEMPSDEYEPEVGTILPRLMRCRDAGQVQQIVHEEFSEWFSPEVAGPPDHYRDVSVALWKLWQNHDRAGRDA
jgi:hypothetical protein